VTDPGGAWSTALEAQLAPIMEADITVRTEQMNSDGVSSIWFNDRPRASAPLIACDQRSSMMPAASPQAPQPSSAGAPLRLAMHGTSGRGLDGAAYGPGQ
jgi:hypothetical protein